MKETEKYPTDQLLSRKGVAERWRVSGETVKRRQREGILHPIYFNRRLLRYRLSEILQVEREASNGKVFNGKPTFPAAKSERPVACKVTGVSKTPKRPPEPGAPKTADLPRVGFQAS